MNHVDWLKALNKEKERLNVLGPLCLWQYFEVRTGLLLESAKSLSGWIEMRDKMKAVVYLPFTNFGFKAETKMKHTHFTPR